MNALEKVDYRKFIAPIVVGLIIWFAGPLRPDALSLSAWHMFAILWLRLLAWLPNPCLWEP
ncbi:hypothetical protein ACG92U_07880 [Leuconostoc citreum]